MRAKVLIQNDPKLSQKWSNPIVCGVKIFRGVHPINFQRESYLEIYLRSASISVKTHVHVIQLEYKLKDSSSDYFKLPDSLTLNEDYLYQRYTITRTDDIKRTYYLENHKELLSVKFGLIFGTEENQNLFKLKFKKEQPYNENVRTGTNSENWCLHY